MYQEFLFKENLENFNNNMVCLIIIILVPKNKNICNT
mgnify:CR=1 FL=1